VTKATLSALLAFAAGLLLGLAVLPLLAHLHGNTRATALGLERR
jgi:hypothetical protein